MKPFNGVAGSLRAIQASLLTVHCAGWALWHQAGTQEETVQSAVHNKWIPGLQRITGPWTVDGQTQALELLREGGALVIANHQSMLDIPLLMSACGPVPRFTAKAAIRSWPILGAFLSATGTCFIDRRTPRAAQRAMRQWGETVRAKPRRLIAGFQEGSRSRTGQLQPLKSGLFRVAAECGMPIVVVLLDPEALCATAVCVIPPNPNPNALREHARKALSAPPCLASLN